jgi:hypothetical protein
MDQTTLQQRASEHYKTITTDAGLTLKPKMRPCEECGDQVIDRSVVYRLQHGYKGVQHWDVRCSGCSLKRTVSSPLDDENNK